MSVLILWATALLLLQGCDPRAVGDESLTCGDGRLADGEECDDGSGVDHDGCSVDCRMETLQWSRVQPATSPPARGQHALVYDAGRQRLVLFGGEGADYGLLADTWAYDGGTWRETTPSAAPQARCDPLLAFDGRRGRVVLFQGGGGDPDTWEFDGTAWRETTPGSSPPRRTQSAVAYHPDGASVILFGGRDTGTFYADTWRYRYERPTSP